MGVVGGEHIEMNIENSYGFDEQLIASNGIIQSCEVSGILRARLPGCVSVRKTSPDLDRRGVDWIAGLANGRTVGVDVKSRTIDYAARGNDDLALETFSVIDTKPGWTRDHTKLCEWVLWLWSDTGRFCLMPFPPLCGVFQANWQEWRKIYRPHIQRTPESATRPEWRSECVFVPRQVVIDSVVDWCNGTIEQEFSDNGR